MAENRGRILVSGASVAGLTVAYWLDRFGFEVTVVERSDGLRPGGQALDVRGPALEVARRMGVLEELRGRTTELRGMSMVDNSGTEIYRTTERTLTGGRLDSEDLEVLRDDLVGILRGACGAGVRFAFGDRIVSLEQDDGGVDVRFEKAAPGRYDVVIGADGAHSGVRRLAFGPEEQFLRYMGGYVAIMTVPNFLGLDRWQTFLMGDDSAGAGLIGLDASGTARAYLGFESEEPVAFDHRDEEAQKRLLAERASGLGWVVPQIVEHMRADASGFHFDARIQVIMEHWTKGRVALVGDAGYAVSLTTGQGASMAMAGAYVLAGELAAAGGTPAVAAEPGSMGGVDLAAGITRYEDAIREYVLRNQVAARELNDQDDGEAGPGDFADFGSLVEDLPLRDYRSVA